MKEYKYTALAVYDYEASEWVSGTVSAENIETAILKIRPDIEDTTGEPVKQCHITDIEEIDTRNTIIDGFVFNDIDDGFDIKEFE